MKMPVMTLGDIGKWGSGGTPTSDTSEYYGGSIPWLLIEDLNDGVVKHSRKTITEVGLKNSSAKLVEPGTLLIAMYGSIGKLGVAGVKLATNQAIAFCTVDPAKITIWYLFFYLLYSRATLASGGKGVTQQNISQTILKEFPIPLPELKEQERIAGILARADRLRQLRRYALQLSDGYLQSVFLQMFGDPLTNPMGWQVGKLRQLCKTIVDCPHSTPTYASNETPYACVRSSDIQNGFFDWSTTKSVSFAEYQVRIQRLEPKAGDIVYCREGARFGNAARIPPGKKVCLGQRTMLFRADERVATPEFIWALLETDTIYQQAVKVSGGSASPHVNVRDIKMFQVVIPPIEKQHIFSRIVHRFERLRTYQHAAILQADYLFDTLLNRAFCGELYPCPWENGFE